MAENPGTKSEHFAWNDGRRIVDLCELSKQLHCKQCSSLLDLQRTEREARYGLVSVLFIPCNCGVMNDVHTGKMQCGGLRNSADPVCHYEVNAKASAHLLMYGADTSRILSFLALLDIPLPAPDDPSLTVVVKKDASDVHCPSHSHPSQMHSSYTSSAMSFSVEPSVSRTCALQTASPQFHSSDTAVTSVPLALPAPPHQHWDRDSGDDHEDNDNSCDNNSDSRSAAADGDLKEIKNDMIEIDGTKTDDGRGEYTMSNANRSLRENKDEEDGTDEYVPPMKIRAKAHNSRKMKKPSAEKLRKTQAAAREPLKVVVQKVPRTRAKIKKEKRPMETFKKQDRKEQADNNKDFSNTLEWSSTESEVEASQDPDSDASWQMEEEKVKPIKAKTTKRGRGRPKGSTDKVKRTRKRETDLKKSVSREEVRAGGVEDGGVPRCTACGKDFNSIRGYNLHMTKMHNQGRHHQDPRSHQERQNQQGHDEDTDSEVKEPPVVAPERPGQVTQEEEVTAELFRCPRCCSVFSDPRSFFSHTSRSHPTLETEEKGKLYPVPLKDSVMKRRVVHEDGTETLSYRCCKCCDDFLSPSVLGKHLCIDSDSRLSCVTLCPSGAKIRGKVMELAFRRKLPCLCNICGKVYSNQGILKTHMETVHTVNKLFSCSVCGVSFSRPSSLQSHMETHEANRPRPFVCQTCGKRFYALHHLKKHERDQHLNSACFTCLVCGKAFSTRRTLDSHKIIHSGHRTYSCSVCFMKFYKKYNLTVHERIHSGVKPYKCSVCPLTFAQKNSLNVHIKKHGRGIKKGSKLSDSKSFDADVTGSSSETCASHDKRFCYGDDAVKKA